MIRFVMQRHDGDARCGLDRREIYTLDVDVPELEVAMTRGGRSEMSFESHQLIGAEILPAEEASDDE